MRMLVALSTSLAVGVAVAASASGCECACDPSTADYLTAYELVFDGRPVRSVLIDGEVLGREYLDVTFEVDDVWVGEPVERILVRTQLETDSGSCDGIHLFKDQPTLVFANRDDDGFYYTASCSGFCYADRLIRLGIDDLPERGARRSSNAPPRP
jgi:hypothetical protein